MNQPPDTEIRQEIVQSIRNIDTKLHDANNTKEFAELEYQLADALEQMLRQVIQKRFIP